MPASLDDAPRARLIAALGPPTAALARPARRDERFADWLLLSVAMLALVAEWASRRLRGAR
jgi:hypothetical protein